MAESIDEYLPGGYHLIRPALLDREGCEFAEAGGPHQQRPADVAGSGGDRWALDRLQASGVDIGRLRDVAHTLRLPDDSPARPAAEAVRQPGRTVVVGPVGDSFGCPVIVFVLRPLTLDAIETLRNEPGAVPADLGDS